MIDDNNLMSELIEKPQSITHLVRKLLLNDNYNYDL